MAHVTEKLEKLQDESALYLEVFFSENKDQFVKLTRITKNGLRHELAYEINCFSNWVGPITWAKEQITKLRDAGKVCNATARYI